jgi:hypothetical protein
MQQSTPISNNEGQFKTPRYQREKKCPLSDAKTPKTSGKKKRPISLTERRPVSVYTAVQTPNIKNFRLASMQNALFIQRPLTVYKRPILTVANFPNNRCKNAQHHRGENAPRQTQECPKRTVAKMPQNKKESTAHNCPSIQ